MADPITLIDSTMEIFDGELILSTTIGQGGSQVIHSGGTAAQAGVETSGGQFVSSGGLAAATVISQGGSQVVFSGGLVQDTRISSGGRQILSGGTANRTTVSRGGEQHISNGGYVLSTTVYGTQFIDSGGMAEVTTATAAARQYVYSGGTLISGTVLNRGLQLLSGGITSSSHVHTLGEQHIFSGGTAIETTVLQNGSQFISDGGLAVSAWVGGYASSVGSQIILSGGRADFTLLEMYGEQHVSEGGLVHSTVISRGVQIVSSGGTADHTIVSSSCSQFILSGGLANSTVLKKSGVQSIHSGGTANFTEIETFGSQYILDGGIADSTIINSYGFQFVSSGGTALNGSAVNSGAQIVFSGGFAQGATIISDAYQGVASGGTAYNTVLRAGGRQTVSQGAIISGTIIESDGLLIMLPSASAVGVVQSSGGRLHLNYNQGNPFSSRAIVTVEKNLGISLEGTNDRGDFRLGDGIASNFNIYDGTMQISSGGTAINTLLDGENAVQIISSGGVASGAIVRAGARLALVEAATLGGTVELAGLLVTGGAVDAAAATVDFTLPEVLPGNEIALLDNLANLVGADFTITVKPDQAYGTYRLADGAADFTGCITITETETGRETSLAVNGSPRQLGTRLYTLNVFDDTLSLTVAALPGTIYEGLTLPEDRMHLSVLADEWADRTTVNAGGFLFVKSSGLATLTTVGAGGVMTVEYRGSAVDTVIDDGGLQRVVNGTAERTSIHRGGSQLLSAGGIGLSAFVSEGGSQIVAGRGSAVDAAIYSGGLQLMHSGGVASGGAIHSGGLQSVASGGLAKDATVYSAGTQTVAGVASGTLLSGGSQTVAMSGAGYHAQIFSGGEQHIASGGTGYHTQISSGGAVYAESSGTAVYATVSSGGALHASNGGIASNAIVSSGGFLYCQSGTLAGTITLGGQLIAGENTVVARQSVLDLRLDQRHDGTELFIDNLGNVSGTAAYAVTVRMTQDEGEYRLAGGTDSLNGDFAVTIKLNRQTDNLLGTFRLGDRRLVNGIYYEIRVNEAEQLCLSIARPERASFDEVFETVIAPDNLKLESEPLELAAGRYTVDGDYSNLNGKISVKNSAGKVMASGTVRNGVLSFKETALAAGSYTIVYESTDRGKSEGALTLSLKGQIFNRIDLYDNWTDVPAGPGSLLPDYHLGGIAVAANSLFDGWVGFGDEIDYRAFTLETGASLTFTLEADNKAKLTLYTLVYNEKKDTYSLKAVKSAADNKSFTALLKEGTYHLGVKSTNANQGVGANYLVHVEDTSAFFDRGDRANNWTDLKKQGDQSREFTRLGDLGESLKGEDIVSRAWVEYGNEWDYYQFSLTDDTNLALSLTADNNVKLYLYQLTEKNGVYSLKTVKSVSVSGKNLTRELTALLKEGTYYLGVNSTNANQGKGAEYSISVEESSVFFHRGDRTNDWTDLKKQGDQSREFTRLGDFTNDLKGKTIVAGKWVEFGSEWDYCQFSLTDDANLTLSLTADNNAQLHLYQLTEKNGVYSLKTVKSVSVSGKNLTKSLTALLTEGTYYLGVKSTNASQGKGAEYSITVGDSSVFFTKGDLDDNWADLNVALPERYAIGLDETPLSGWVGYNDRRDCLKLDLEGGRSYTAFLTSTDNVKLTIYELIGSPGKHSLKAIKSLAVSGSKLNAEQQLAFTLGGGDYYLAIESTNAAKGGNADYGIRIA